MKNRNWFEGLMLLFVGGFLLLQWSLLPFLTKVNYHQAGRGILGHPAVILFVFIAFSAFLVAMYRLYEVVLGKVRRSPMMVMSLLLLPIYQLMMLVVLALLHYRMGSLILYTILMDFFIIALLRFSALYIRQKKYAYHL